MNIEYLIKCIEAPTNELYRLKYKYNTLQHQPTSTLVHSSEFHGQDLSCRMYQSISPSQSSFYVFHVTVVYYFILFLETKPNLRRQKGYQ